MKNLRPDSKILVQGITEPLGAIYTARMKAYGTNVVAGVSPGKGGQKLDDIPIFDLVEQALSVVGQVDATIIFVPPYSVMDAALEAIASGISQIILNTGGVPPLDMVRLLRKAAITNTLIVGPHSSGIIMPGKILLGSQESEFYTPGSIGLISHTDILTYEVAWELTQAGLGQSLSVSLGNSAIIGSSFCQWLKILDKDENTKAIVLVGQSGSGNESDAAQYIANGIDKPVVAYIAGGHLPSDKRLDNVTAIIASQLSGPIIDSDTAQSKIAAFKQAKIPVAKRPSQIPDLVKKALKK
jgi:succinyl-CoA synthetase alpha subunit